MNAVGASLIGLAAGSIAGGVVGTGGGLASKEPKHDGITRQDIGNSMLMGGAGLFGGFMTFGLMGAYGGIPERAAGPLAGFLLAAGAAAGVSGVLAHAATN